MLDGLWEILAIPFGFLLKILYILTNDLLHLPFAFMFAIVLFALLTNIPLYPLALRQQRFNVVASVYRPMIDEINRRFASNKKRLNEELEMLETEFGYKKGIGALPYIIQFLIIFGLIEVINKPLRFILNISKDLLLELKMTTATLITDVTGLTTTEAADKISITMQSRKIESHIFEQLKVNATAFFDIAAKNPDFSNEINAITNFSSSIGSFNLLSLYEFTRFSIALFPIILLLFTLLSSYISMRNSQGFHERNSMRNGIITMIATSLIFLFLSIIYPIGFSIYWVTVCIYTIIQSFILKNTCDTEKITAEHEAIIAERIRIKEESRRIKVTDIDGIERQIELSDEEVNELRLKKSREKDAKRFDEDYSNIDVR